MYGINGISPLTSINDFEIANFQMPQDVMHVVLEGVLPMEIKNLLNTFMFEDGLFSVEFLNERVQNFTYGRVEARNKPPKPFQSSQFTSATQKLHLSGKHSKLKDSK